MIKSVDGLGPPGPKINTYRVVNRTTPEARACRIQAVLHRGRGGSSRLMKPREVLGLKPQPEYVMYE